MVRFAAIVCVSVLAACAASTTLLAIKTGPYPGDELSVSALHIGGFATAVSAIMVIWLILDTARLARAWAVLSLALLLAGMAIWHWFAWPRFWDSLGSDDCLTDCFATEHITARSDFVVGKWAVATTYWAATTCALIALLRRAPT